MLHAFRQLVLQLLVQDPVTWRVRIMRALGVNAVLIIEVIPELARLIGPHPPVSKVSPAEAATRFSVVFLQFVNALSAPISPLTLFIDDLQWADSGSLALLQLLVSQEEAHLLVIGAFRDNEVDDTHPLTALMTEARQTAPQAFTHVQLSALSTTHICALIVDSFRCSQAEAQPLAQLLSIKTQGNPFYLCTRTCTAGVVWLGLERVEWQTELTAFRLISPCL